MAYPIREAYKNMIKHEVQTRKRIVLEGMESTKFSINDKVKLDKEYHGIENGAIGKVVDVLDNNYLIIEFSSKKQAYTYRVGFSPVEANILLSTAA